MAKSNIDKNLFNALNRNTPIVTPIQTVVPIEEKKEDVSKKGADLVGFFARIAPSLKKQIKTYSVLNEITQDALISKILEEYFDAHKN